MNDIASNNIHFHVSHSKRLWYSLGGIPLCLPKVILNKFQLCAQQRAINLTGANPVCEGLANQQ